MTRFSQWAFVLSLFVCLSQLQAETPQGIGLALGGGGVRGIAHIGVLQALEEMHIPIRAISGTSIGALVGALYASGYSPQEMKKLLTEISWERLLFEDRASRLDAPIQRKNEYGRFAFDFEMGLKNGKAQLPSSLSLGHSYGLLLNRLFYHVREVQDFSKLPISFRAFATDLETGESVALKSGRLPRAVQASTSYPALFAPIEVDGRLLTDGGPTNNLPVESLHELRMPFVLAVDVNSPLLKRQQIQSFLDITEQVINIMVRKAGHSEGSKAEALLIPDMNDHKPFEFFDFNRLIQAGYEATYLYKDQLKKFSISETAFRNHLAKVQKKNLETAPITLIQLQESSGKVRTLDSNRSYNLDHIEKRANEIYASQDYERVDYESQSPSSVTLIPKAKAWGPALLKFAVSWDGEIKGKQDGNALAHLHISNLNSLGAFWDTEVSIGTVLRLETEFTQPLLPWFFVAPRLTVGRHDEDFYTGSHRQAELEVDSLAGDLAVGVNLGSYAEIKGGIRHGFVTQELELGISNLQNETSRISGLFGYVKWDQVDSLYAPRRGYYLSSQIFRSFQALQASDAYRKSEAEAHAFIPWGRLSLVLQVAGGAKMGHRLPSYDEFLLGGFQTFSGYREEEMRGQYYGRSRTGILIELPLERTFFYQKTYVGSWMDIGNMWMNLDHMSSLKHGASVALGFQTKIGMAWLAYGQADPQHQQFYVSVGRTFGFNSMGSLR